jgi:predicted RNA-binding Zn ribbon-like protein
MDVDAPVLYAEEPRAVRLMNTIWADRAGVHDSLASIGLLRGWAEPGGLGPGRQLGEKELTRARELRDALRRLAAAVTEDTRPAAVSSSVSVSAALATLNGFLAQSKLALASAPDAKLDRTWVADGSRFEQELGVGACGGPSCVLYFTKKDPRRAYCSAGCGNRARVARHYRRHKADH